MFSCRTADYTSVHGDRCVGHGRFTNRPYGFLRGGCAVITMYGMCITLQLDRGSFEHDNGHDYGHRQVDDRWLAC